MFAAVVNVLDVIKLIAWEESWSLRWLLKALHVLDNKMLMFSVYLVCLQTTIQYTLEFTQYFIYLHCITYKIHKNICLNTLNKMV